MELCVRFSKNISELNGRGVVLCLRNRCSQTGNPTAAAQARNHGVKNPIDLQSPLANLQILAQPLVQGPPGIHQEIVRSEEHTSELQSLRHLVCRLLLEKKKRGERHAFAP